MGETYCESKRLAAEKSTSSDARASIVSTNNGVLSGGLLLDSCLENKLKHF